MASSMEIILLERVERLGLMGDLVKVRPGYARNYLLPHKKALRATRENKELFARQRVVLEADNLARGQEAKAVAVKMEGLEVVILSPAEEKGTLYGSVGAREVTSALGEAGFKFSRSQIILKHPIKNLGLHEVTLALHPEVMVRIVVNVARSILEAEQRSGSSPGSDGETLKPDVPRSDSRPADSSPIRDS